jgi:hypothetical protein
VTGRALAGVALAGVALTAACGGGAAAPGAGPPPSSAPADPVDVCTNQIDYWAGVDLAGDAADPGFDYQHRALSARVDTALRAIVEQARAEGGASPEVIRERARAACAELIAADPDPSGF